MACPPIPRRPLPPRLGPRLMLAGALGAMLAGVCAPPDRDGDLADGMDGQPRISAPTIAAPRLARRETAA